MQEIYWQCLILALLMIGTLGVIYHYKFVPPLSLDRTMEILDFITASKGVKIDSSHELPQVYIRPIEEVAQIPFPAGDLSGAPIDFMVECYYHEWRRIFVAEGCRENVLIHALVHYVQFEYGPLFPTEAENDEEAWLITKQFLKSKYPWRYWLLTIPYGIFCWWTSTPY